MTHYANASIIYSNEESLNLSCTRYFSRSKTDLLQYDKMNKNYIDSFICLSSNIDSKYSQLLFTEEIDKFPQSLNNRL